MVGINLDRHVVAALNGDQMTRNAQLPLVAGDTVAFLSADGGAELHTLGAVQKLGRRLGRWTRLEDRAASPATLALDGMLSLRAYLGGVGLGTRPTATAKPGRGRSARPKSAALAFVFSPLAGTPLTTSAEVCRRGQVRRSPACAPTRWRRAGSRSRVSSPGTTRSSCAGWLRRCRQPPVDGGRGAPSHWRPSWGGLRPRRPQRPCGSGSGAGGRPRPQKGGSRTSATPRSATTVATRAAVGSEPALGAKNVKAVLVRSATRVSIAEGGVAAAKDLRGSKLRAPQILGRREHGVRIGDAHPRGRPDEDGLDVLGPEHRAPSPPRPAWRPSWLIVA